jgi:hypothetical protein
LRRAREAVNRQGGCRTAFALFRFHRNCRRRSDSRGTMQQAARGRRSRDLETLFDGALSARATARTQ